MAYFIDLRATQAGGFLADEAAVRRDDEQITLEELKDAIKGRHVLLATHGFMVNRAEGIDELGCCSDLMELKSALFVGVLWPGDSQWAMGLDYPFEGGEAVASGQKLGEFLRDHFSAALSLSFASHSLGARVVLETIRRASLPVKYLILMAGAMDDDCLSAEYKDAARMVERIAILASKQDYVLWLAFPTGNLVHGLVYGGHPYWSSAIGRSGPSEPRSLGNKLHAPWEIPSDWDFGHGDYLGSRAENEPEEHYHAPQDVPGPDEPVSLNPDGVPMTKETKPSWAASFIASRLSELFGANPAGSQIRKVEPVRTEEEMRRTITLT